jgi:hypothetical protein
MDDNDEKPSLAAGMAKRGFWMAVIGGLLGTACRVQALGSGVQAMIALVAIALLLIAAVFAVVALIRVTHADRNAVLIPGLAGLLLSIWFQTSLARWERDDWSRARQQALKHQRDQAMPQAQIAAVRPAPRIVTPAPQVSLLKHELPLFDQIPTVVPKIMAEAAGHAGEDAGVFRAWAAHLDRLHAAYTNTFTAYNQLHQVDLLNPWLIANFNDEEVIRRRGLANKYAEEWRNLENKVSTFSGSFYEDLRKERISPDRTSLEAKAIFAFVDQPETAARLALLQKFCKAEEEVGRYYNYAVSSVFQYMRAAKTTPEAAASVRSQMDESIRKLREAEQVAAALRREVSTPPVQKLSASR